MPAHHTAILSLHCCLTDGSFVLLGGQHIASILIENYKKQTKPLHQQGLGMNPDDLPMNEKFVTAQILRHGTPLNICRLAAGLHQYRQRFHAESGFSTTVGVIAQAYREFDENNAQPVRELPRSHLGSILLQHGKLADRKDKDGSQKQYTVCDVHETCVLT